MRNLLREALQGALCGASSAFSVFEIACAALGHHVTLPEYARAAMTGSVCGVVAFAWCAWRRAALVACLLVTLVACGSNTGAQGAGVSSSPVGPVMSASAPAPIAPAAPPPAAPAPSAPRVATPGVFFMAIVGSQTVTGQVVSNGGTYIWPPLEVEVRDSLGAIADGVYVQFEDASLLRLGLGTATTGDISGYTNTGPGSPLDFPSTQPGTGRAGAQVEATVIGPRYVKCHAISYRPSPAQFPTGLVPPQVGISYCNDVTFTVVGVP